MRKNYVLPVLADPHFVRFVSSRAHSLPNLHDTVKFTQVMICDSDPHGTMFFQRVGPDRLRRQAAWVHGMTRGCRGVSGRTENTQTTAPRF